MGEAENLLGWGPNKQIKDMQVYVRVEEFSEKSNAGMFKMGKQMIICGLNLGLSANKN